MQANRPIRSRIHGGKPAYLPTPGLILAVCLAWLISGCTSMPARSPGSTADQYDGDIEDYAEYVFRRQNHISSRIILLTMEGDEDERYQTLISAEEKIMDACSPLNRIAIRRAEKRSISPGLKYKAYNSLEKCESTTRDAEQLLQDF